MSDFLVEHYTILLDMALDKNELDAAMHDELSAMPLDTLDKQEEAYQMLLTEIERKKIHDRIVKGAEMIEKEPDPVMKRQYMAVYEQLIVKLETLKSA